MNHIILTPRGQEILTTAANNVSGEGIKWIGYYGLAYVPFPSGADSQFSDSLIREDEHGDYIYNIWQGDLLGSGFVGGKVNTLTLYDANLASNYRYVYDEEKGCNRLVTWTTDGDPLGEDSDPSKTPKQFIRTGYRIYEGVKIADEGDEAVESDTGMPVPAPLFYMGDDSTYSRPLDASGVTGKVGDGPVVKSGDAQGAPLVTPDMRFYDGPLSIDDSTFTSLVSSSGTISPFDVVPSGKTRGEDLDAESLDQFAKFKSVSNYNKGHGHVSSEGYGMDAQESCHNMSLVTKLFPISTYEVTSDGPATTGETLTDTGSRNRAKVIKYGIKLNLNDAVTGMQLLNDRYEYKAPDDIEPEDESARELYTNPPMNSLKFNRIGIYAVDATIRHFNKSEAGSAGCLANSYQVEISPDAKPELIAVMLIDECCISEDSSFGMNSFSTNFILNLENVTESTSVCTNPEVYYNLSENEAVTWYQNQLLASAGLSEAVTSLGVDIAHLKNQYGAGSNDCYAKSDGTEYASKDHTHDYLKNLVDDEGQDGSVRGIMSNPHSVPYAPLGKTEAWGCGKLSFTMGDDNATAGNFSFNLTAKGAIDDASSHVLLMGGDAEDNADYLVVKNSSRSIVMGVSGTVSDVDNSILILGDSTDVAGASHSLVLDGGHLPKTTKLNNSDVDLGGTDIEVGDEDYIYPSEFKNVVWKGSIFPLSFVSRRATGEETEDEVFLTPMRDVGVFIPQNIEANRVQDWLGRGYYLRALYSELHDSGRFPEITPETIIQPSKSSVIFAGGMALGGHLTPGGEKPANEYYEPGDYGLLKLGTPHTATLGNERDLHVNRAQSIVSIKPGNITIRGVDIGDNIDDPIQLLGANFNNEPHYVVHSPHAGKPLVVAETQELDGTLHIGLGQDVRHGNDNFVSVECSYIASAAAVVVKVKYRDITAPGSTVSEAFKLTIEGEDEVITEPTTTEITATPGVMQNGNFVEDATVPSYSGISIHGNVERYPDPARKSRIIDLTFALPADRAAFYHIFGGSTVGSFINSTYYDIMPGAFRLQLANCTNITNTNTFIRYTGTPIVDLPYVYVIGPFIHEYQSNLYNALGRATIELSKLYRISAVNYHDADGNIPKVVASNEYGMRIEEIPIDYSGSGNAVIDVPDPRSLKGCYYVVEQPADNEWSDVPQAEWYYSSISSLNRTAELVLNPILHGKYDVTVPDYIDTPYGAVNRWAVDHFEVNWSSLLRGGDDFYIRADKAFKINDPLIGQISCDANTWYRVEVITEVRNLDTYPSTMNYYRVTSI
jgi:hypothetical protein